MHFARHIALITFVVLWTTIRHEGSHACAALFEGAEIQAIRLLPGMDNELGFYFGYVLHTGEVTWLTDSAPFIADAIFLVVAAFLLWKLPQGSRWRFYTLMFGIISPLADLTYAYQSGLWRSGTDVADLFLQLPSLAVHMFFLVAIVFGVFLLRFTHRNRATTME